MPKKIRRPPGKPFPFRQRVDTAIKRANAVAHTARALNVICVIVAVVGLSVANKTHGNNLGRVAQTVYIVGFVVFNVLVMWVVTPFWAARERYKDTNNPVFRAIYLKSLQRYVLADALLIAWSVSLLLQVFGISEWMAGFVRNVAYRHGLAWIINAAVSGAIGNATFFFLVRGLSKLRSE